MPRDNQQTSSPICSDKRTTPHGKPFRSKLLPFAAEIAKWQRDGKTYEQIAVLLRTQHGLRVHPDTINSFVLVRVRARKKRILPAEYLQPSHAREHGESAENALREQPLQRVAPNPRAVRGSDGKEIRNAQYAPVNPDDL